MAPHASDGQGSHPPLPTGSPPHSEDPPLHQGPPHCPHAATVLSRLCRAPHATCPDGERGHDPGGVRPAPEGKSRFHQRDEEGQQCREKGEGD